MVLQAIDVSAFAGALYATRHFFDVFLETHYFKMLYWMTMNNFFGFSVVVSLGVLLVQVSMVEAASTSTMTTATTTASMTASTTVASTTATTATTLVLDQAAVEKRVREYFADAPAMIQIARCESNFRQYTDSGKSFRGGAGDGMVGVFQLYEKLHTAGAHALGFDITTLEGNLGYTRHMYKQEGTTPWASCEPTPILYDNSALRIELVTKLIELLQQLLALKLAEKS